MAVRRPPRADVTVYVTVAADSRIDAELTAIGMAMGIHPHTVMAVASRSELLSMDDAITNEDRAWWASEAVDAYQHITKTDNDSALSDLLTDLRHYADLVGADWDAVIARAERRYDEEVLEEAEGKELSAEVEQGIAEIEALLRPMGEGE